MHLGSPREPQTVLSQKQNGQNTVFGACSDIYLGIIESYHSGSEFQKAGEAGTHIPKIFIIMQIGIQ